MIVLSGRMRLVGVLFLCLATGALARSRQLNSSSHVFEKAEHYSCDVEGNGLSLLALSLIHRAASAAADEARWLLTAARGRNNDEKRLDAAVGLPSSSFVLFLPLGESGEDSERPQQQQSNATVPWNTLCTNYVVLRSSFALFAGSGRKESKKAFWSRVYESWHISRHETPEHTVTHNPEH